MLAGRSPPGLRLGAEPVKKPPANSPAASATAATTTSTVRLADAARAAGLVGGSRALVRGAGATGSR